MAIDPVCKMKVEPGKAAAKAEHAGQVYYFCSESCHKSFVADPKKYSSGAAAAEHACCGGQHRSSAGQGGQADAAPADHSCCGGHK